MTTPARRLTHQPATPAILSIGTALPQYQSNQIEIGNWMAESFKEQPTTQRLVRTIHAYSGIETRYSCTPHFLTPVEESPLAPGHGLDRVLTTAERMAIYTQEAPLLGIDAARKAVTSLGQKSAVDAESIINGITHIIAVSCTGFFAPGLDFMIAHQLGLPATVKRSLIGFMGCSAAFNALRTAREIVAGAPAARVLVVCVELCTLHAQNSSDRDRLVATAIFADGAAAAIVGMPTEHGADYLALPQFYTSMKPDTQEEMVWRVGNHGFELYLSPRIPEHLAGVAPDALHQLFDDVRPSFWAIHPGGRAIVERLAEIFALTDDEIWASFDVLRRYGNMSSGTILFVLAQIWDQLAAVSDSKSTREFKQKTGHEIDDVARENVPRDDVARESIPIDGVAMAFGPGLMIEMARIVYVPAVADYPIGDCTDLSSDDLSSVTQSDVRNGVASELLPEDVV